MKFARGFLIFCYGLFTIAAQALLFREFITTFEGNDISVGLFFASWFFWIGLGAIVAYRPLKITAGLLKKIDLLFFAYIPAFVLELVLIIQARQIAGVSSYALWSICQMVFLSLLVNAPVSIITGMLFPLACRWIEQDSLLPVSSVYIFEAAGSFFGGIVATILLGLGVNSTTIFFLLALVVSSAVFVVRFAEIKLLYEQPKATLIFASSIIVCILLCLLAGVDKSLNRYIQIVKWTKLLPAEALTGSFQTAQAEYLYGTYRGQWVVVRQGSTCEVLPDKAGTGRIAAIALSQKPEAKKILVVGSGLGLCYEFLLLPQIEQVTWTHCDSQYVRQVDRFLPAQFKISDSRLLRLGGDIRRLLAGQKNLYDIVIINLPEATSSVLNRYFTCEFYRQLKNSMAADGIVAVRITGGENIMGTELIDLGASTKRTLEKVFSHFVLTPGDDTWFIASDSDRLTGAPGILQERYARIKNAEAVFVPSALLSVYLPDRAAVALENYNSADLPQELLINRDSRPLASLYSLLLASKQSGTPITRIVKLLATAGVFVFLIPVFVFVVLRFFYIARAKNQNRISSLDGCFLVFSAGWLGIGMVVVLMYLYQTSFGSLYLHIGVISSLFMIGLTAGAVLVRYLPVRLSETKAGFQKYGINLFVVILIHAALLVVIAYLPADSWTHYSFAAVFFLCGLCTGAYFPIAAGQLAEGGFETGLAGAKLEMADHIGASAGSLVTGLALVPMLGTKGTILISVAIILANVPAALLKAFRKSPSFAAPALDFRRVGYVLFGTAVSVIICSNLLTHVSADFKPSLPKDAAQMLAGPSRIEPVESTLPGLAEKFHYFKVYETKEKLTGYIFSTEDLAPEVYGFGGKINLAVYIDTTGKLINFHMLRSNETPSYLEMLTDWRQKLNGRQLFQVRPFDGVDSVTGATVSSKAIVSAIELSSKKFASEVLSQTIPIVAEKKPFPPAYLPDRSALYLLVAVGFSLIVIYRGNFWSRLAVLVFNLVVGGFVLNAQYSSQQVASLLSGQKYAPGLSGAFLLTVGVPLLVLLFGNIYCGYLCPFGAVQELLGYIIPDRLKQPVPYEKMRKARFVKYVILFILIMVFFLSRSKQTLVPDPLISVFNLPISLWFAVSVIMLAVVGSVFYRRFWCRYLCPVGAFLSLLNNLVVLKRFIPAKSFAGCEFGLTARDNMDCLYCDRCRYRLKPSSPEIMAGYPLGGLTRYLLFSVLIIGIFVSALYIDKFFDAIPSPAQYSSTSAYSAGQPRDVDLRKIRTMIEEKKLSDHEAEFYKKAD
jgi:spermidine synthase